MATGGAGEWRQLLNEIERGNESQVENYLALEKVDVNFQHPEIGTTALLAAVKSGNLKIVKLLVEKGHADVNQEASVMSEGTPCTVCKGMMEESITCGAGEKEKKLKSILDYLISKGGTFSSSAVQVDPKDEVEFKLGCFIA